MLLLPAMAQQTGPQSLGSAIFYAQMEPASSGAIRGWNSARFREGNDTLIRAWVYGAAPGVYWGCEILLKPRGNGAYLASFAPLRLTEVDFTRYVQSPLLGDPALRKLEPPPAYPAPQLVKVGETLAIDLMVNGVTGEKLTGYLEIDRDVSNSTLRSELGRMSTAELREFEKQIHERLDAANEASAAAFGRQQSAAAPRADRSLGLRRQTSAITQKDGSSGGPRDFTAEDAGMEIFEPNVWANGVALGLTSSASASGSFLWFYLPGRGRFIVSLASHAGFAATGRVQSNLLELRDGSDSIVFESRTPIVDLDGTYVIYVKSEAGWQPRPPQAAGFQLGSLSVADFALSAVR
jgi:hypothetical protein